MTNYNDGKWHGWNGGECPVHPETLVEVAHRGQGTTQARARLFSFYVCENGSGETMYTPVAFRVIEEYKAPREFWVTKYPCGEVNIHKTKKSAEMVGASYRGGEIIHVREVLE